jgi:hypothetical protein
VSCRELVPDLGKLADDIVSEIELLAKASGAELSVST